MDGFNDRVGKVFDCISSSSKGAAAWSLSDAQIQRQPWNHRDKGGNKSSDITIINKDDDETLVSSSFDNLFKSNNKKKKKNNTFDDPDDDEFEDDDDAGDDERIDDLDVRSSIGLDPTLDFEEEEDEYDKIAAGTENAGSSHLLYMKDVTHHAPFLNSHNVLQHHTTFTTTSTNTNNDNDDDQPMFNAPSQPSLDNALKLKSILKRKSQDLEKPSAKRVRFDPTCKHHDAPPQLDGVPVPQVSNIQRSRVPDYLVNPSKYTRYTFNEDDHDDKSSNTEAYYDFLDQIKKSKDVAGLDQKPPAADLPASVVFIPRKKRGDAAPSNSDGQVKESSAGVGIGIGIAAVEVQQDEVSDIMLQDEPDVDAVCAKPKFQKPSRQYRSKIEDHDTVS